jgi:hypothetical protein
MPAEPGAPTRTLTSRKARTANPTQEVYVLLFILCSRPRSALQTNIFTKHVMLLFGRIHNACVFDDDDSPTMNNVPHTCSYFIDVDNREIHKKVNVPASAQTARRNMKLRTST